MYANTGETIPIYYLVLKSESAISQRHSALFLISSYEIKSPPFIINKSQRGREGKEMAGLADDEKPQWRKRMLGWWLGQH